jgi:hypothetical protein
MEVPQENKHRNTIHTHYHTMLYSWAYIQRNVNQEPVYVPNKEYAHI